MDYEMKKEEKKKEIEDSLKRVLKFFEKDGYDGLTFWVEDFVSTMNSEGYGLPGYPYPLRGPVEELENYKKDLRKACNILKQEYGFEL